MSPDIERLLAFFASLSSRGPALILALALGVSGCASTRIVNQWSNPDYVAPRFGKIFVAAVTRQSSIRRTFEDEFVARLKAAGVDAVPSYRHIREDGPVDEARLRAAVEQAGADAVLITRLVRVETKTNVTPGMYYPAPALTFGFYDAYTAAWLGYYEPPYVYQYDVYVSETSLYDAATNQLVWTSTVQTQAPGDVDKEIKHYVKRVIEALRRVNLLPRDTVRSTPGRAGGGAHESL
jgi:hypothetical protein